MRSLSSVWKTTLALVVVTCSSVRADVASAEDVAYRMAAKYKDRGFRVYDVDAHGTLSLPTQNYKEFTLHVVRGLDYVFLAALDSADKIGRQKNAEEVIDSLDDVDLYVFSEVGQKIVEDKRGLQAAMAGVQFRADYTGEVHVYFHLYDDGRKKVIPRPVGWYVLVGYRNTAFNKTSDPSTEGIERQLDSTQPAPSTPLGS